jgi:mannose-6-phosphate isomerase-like protein (cupin superfamily)
MKQFSAHGFKSERAWGSELISDFGDVTVRMHWTDKPYKWHQNTGKEVFVVMEGAVDMHFRKNGIEKIVHVKTGEGVSVEDGDEHVAHPTGEARILLVELKDSE